MLIYGAHLIKNGAAYLLDDFLANDRLTHLATNGAGTIHDWEYAWLGRSSECVRSNVATGTFGTWEETGRNIHLSLLAGGVEGLGYGESLGRLVENEALEIPEAAALEQLIQSDPASELTGARAELLRLIHQGFASEGEYLLEHRWKQASVLASAYRHQVSLTVHPGIGYDIIANHPMFNGAAIGRAAQIDFQKIPGYTHLQRAQPVYFAHHLLAYVEMFERDHERLLDAFSRVNVCPLGSGALAGSTLPLDRKQVASFLGFEDRQGKPVISQNSMDAVSDRDFAVEFCFVASLAGVHLSRLAEDIILWSSSEFDFIRISDEYTTGSSLMPQKKNPDIAEIARGKSGRLIGNLMSLLTLLKGLPMTYNRDLQEDKERLFDSVDTIRTTVRLTAAMMRNTSVNASTCELASSDPALLATDLADYLVGQKVPFRDAHHIVGEVVALSEKMAKPLNELTPKELQGVSKKFKADALAVFDLKTALAKRTIAGSPGGKEVKKQLKSWAKRFA